MRAPAILAALLVAVAPAAASEVRVAAQPGALAAAIAAAAPGDVLRLAAGRHEGPVTIDKPLTLTGDGAEVIGPGTGSVMTVTAPGVVVAGLAVTGSGLRLDTLDSGIVIAKGADRVRIEDNVLADNLIGIDVQGGRDAVVRGNTVTGRTDLRESERGPGIYVWNAPGLLVEGNSVAHGRDGVFITTSHHAVYRDNRFSDLRFALHSMYANDIEVTGNLSERNDMGFAFMYSRQVTATGNVSVGDRTHGIFLNFVNKSRITGNEVRGGGEKCLFVYNANGNAIEDNVFEGCAIGVHFTAGSDGNTIAGNAFLGNRTQVKYVGTRWVDWSHAGRGNFWSDHAAFDIDGDGIADSPYRPNDAVDLITWRQPVSKLLLGAPAVQLIRWSQSRFPGLLPGGVVDSHPLIRAGGAGAGKVAP